jgi:hypothetical protein
MGSDVVADVSCMVVPPPGGILANAVGLNGLGPDLAG